MSTRSTPAPFLRRRSQNKSRQSLYERPQHPGPAPNPDLWTQLEDMLGMVRLAEANWRLDDRIDLAVRSYRSQREAA